MENKKSSQPDGELHLSQITKDQFKTLIRVDVDQHFYAITPPELDILLEGASTIWKDVCLSSFGLGIPFLINSIIEINKLSSFVFTLEIFINSLGAGLGIIIGSVSGAVWSNQTNKCNQLAEKIKGRSQYHL